MATFTLTLTIEEISMIAQGLAELPFKHVCGLMNKLDEQVKAQSIPPVLSPDKEKAEESAHAGL